ncbi:MAG: hypothetical protein HPY66_1303 [Firmicutes bacterium]|nr:hypothetical protein [Bacillota bacterium]MDI6705812.1 DUF4367 domain-containing protein [Bacillota bacterium]
MKERYSYDDVDRMLAEAIKREGEKIIPPDKDEVWAEISRRLDRAYERRKKVRFKKIVAVAALTLVIFIGTSILFAHDGRAYFHVFKTFKTLWGNVFNITGFSDTGKVNADESNIEIIDRVTEKDLQGLDAAQRYLDYSIAVPDFIPDRYRFLGVYIRTKDSGFSPIELIYGDDEENYVYITQKPLIQPSSLSYNFRSNDAEVKDVEVNGNEAVMIYFGNSGMRQLMWQTPVNYFTINGPLTEDEIIEIGSSMD